MRTRNPVLLTATVLIAAFAGGGQTVNATDEWRLDTLVQGSPIQSPNGIEFGPDGKLYAGSVGSKTIYRIDVETREVEIVVPPPLGEADDLAFAPDGTLVWTALIAGEIRALRADGQVDVIVPNLPLANPIHFTRDGRLLAGQIGIDKLFEFTVDENWTSTGERRLVTSKNGNLNSFEITDDNVLIGPLVSKGTVVQIDIETGEVTPIADGLGQIVAVNIDRNGAIWGVDWHSGDVWRIDPDGDDWQAPRKVTTLVPPLDNLAISPDGHVYVSRPAHSSIEKVDGQTGEHSTLIAGQFAGALGVASFIEAGQDKLLVADSYGWRIVDVATGQVTVPYDLTQFGFPQSASAVAVNDDYFAFADSVVRPHVWLVDRKTGETVKTWRKIRNPTSISLTRDNTVIVMDGVTGEVIRLTDKE
jgi:sugar lactone lactonase YvrE